MSDNVFFHQGQSGDPLLRTKEVSAGLHAQVMFAGEHVRTSVGCNSLTLTGTAQGITVLSGATHALIQCIGAADTDYASYWEMGTPTASVGKRLYHGQEIPIADLVNSSWIIGAGSPVLRIYQYKYT